MLRHSADRLPPTGLTLGLNRPAAFGAQKIPGFRYFAFSPVARSVDEVIEFLGELYLSRQHTAAVEQSEQRVREVAEQLTREGRPVCFLRTIFVPEDETCFYLFEAESAGTVHEVGTRAAVRFERVSQSWRRHAHRSP